ncbi:MAG: hypothetical protein ACUVTX_06550 [Bacteroidales bacterium]
MNRYDFLGLMNNTGEIDRAAITELKELVEIYPWFQSAHLLLLKGLHNTGDVKFDNQLKQSALSLGSREVLYYLLHPVATEKTVTEKPPVKDIELSEIPDSMQVVIDTGKNSEEIIRMLEREAENAAIISGAGAKDRESPVVITNDSEIDESGTVRIIYNEGDEKVEEAVIFIDPSISTDGRYDLLELDESSTISEVPEEIPGRIQVEEQHGVQEESPAKIHLEISDETPVEITAGIEQTEPVSGEKSAEISQADLIDRFILINPKIEPAREKKDEPVIDISKPYTEAQSGFVTETLAKIYVRQGYYSKAMDIYEKLSLKYPEKSSYFASQIEEIKKLIKQN